MKEQYLTFKDLLCVCTSKRANRFNMELVILYGVNSNGRNSIFAFALSKKSE